MIRDIILLNPPVTLNQLEAFEKRWRIHLPETYRSFLITNNGGVPVPAAFPISGMPDNPTGEIQSFFGLGAAIESQDIEWYLNNIRMPNIPDILPIAGTPTGDYICLDTSKPRMPVVYWDRKECWGDGDSIVFYHVANTFEELLAALDEYPLEFAV